MLGLSQNLGTEGDVGHLGAFAVLLRQGREDL